MRNTEEYRSSRYEEDEDEEDEDEKYEDEENEEYKDEENEEYKEDEDEEYKEKGEAESPHMLAFRQEAKMADHQMYERFDNNLDMADWTWDLKDTESLCILLREAVDNTMGKEQSEAREEVAEEVTKMMFQPLAESMATGKNIYWTNIDRIGDSEKQELLEYIAKDQRAFQTFLADGEMDERNAIKGMYDAIGGGMTWALGDIEMARRVHNPDMQE